MQEDTKYITLFCLAIIAILAAGIVIGHFLFPAKSYTGWLPQYGTYNYSTLNITLDESTGNISITGIHPGDMWLGNVDGISMWPTFRDGSEVLIEQVYANDVIEIGDIVVFNYEDGYTVHRVTGIGEDQEGWYALTEGDNKCEPVLYHKCRRNEIWGKVRIYFDS